MNGVGVPIVEFLVGIEVEPDEGGFHAFCPALSGLHVGGDTKEEALQNAKEAAKAYIVSLMKHGEPIPLGITMKKPRSVSRQAIHHEEQLEVACVR